MLRKRGRGFTNQRGKHALSSCPPNIIAATQHQPLPFDLDCSVRFHLSFQLPYHPDLASGLDATDKVPVDGRGGRSRPLATRDGNDPNAALESRQGIIGYDREDEAPYDEEHRHRCNERFPYDSTSLTGAK